MRVTLVYASPQRQFWHTFELPAAATVNDAIQQSGILQRFPDLDPNSHKVGIFGKIVAFNTVLTDGDRVEIYRPLIADPKQVKQRPKSTATAESST